MPASKMKKGKLIVLEGGDGSGKTVQSKRLVRALNKQGIPTKYIEYPRYQKSFYGSVVARFLNGEFGSLESVSPYLAAIPYALDRMDQRDEIIAWLSEGKCIVANRYVTSSLAHQASKVSEKERPNIISWIEQMEYKENKLPRPDLVLFLHVPWKTAIELNKQQQTKNSVVSGADIAEKNIQHRKLTETVYKELAKKKHWKTISCIDSNGDLMSIPDIHGEILKSVLKLLSK